MPMLNVHMVICVSKEEGKRGKEEERELYTDDDVVKKVRL